jgi:ATP-dependent exoDNAse (exonuclease V) beta subunit
VLTVHKAKGLEFPAVIVPFTRMSSTQRHGDPVWIDPGASIPELPTALVPTERLYAFVREKSTDPLDQGLVDFVRARGDGSVFATGTTGRAATNIPVAPKVLQAAPSAGHHEPAIRFEAPEAWDPADPDPFRRHGTLVHALMAELRTADDLPDVLSKAVQRGDLDQAEADKLRISMDAMIRAPLVAPFYSGEGATFSEITLIDLDGHSLRPDRVIERDGGWTVLDIKTGAPSDRHHEQVRRYSELLASITGSPVAGILLYLRSGEMIPVT